MSDNIVKNGMYVLIFYDKRREWLRKVEKDQQFHCDRGFLNFNDIIGKTFGQEVRLSSGRKVGLFRPTITDKIYHMKRISQIIYPEDISLILTYGNVQANSKILEAGTGSASLTGCMGRYCQPAGMVKTFDLRKKAYDQAIENIDLIGVQDTVNLNLGNFLEKKDQLKDLNFIMLDLPNTWEMISELKENLLPDGRFCLFNPVIEQVGKNLKELKKHDMTNYIVLEMLKRDFQVKPNATRPYGRVVGHTGYLTFVEKNNEVPIISDDYNNYYSPENIGYLLLHGNIHLKRDLAVICPKESKIPSLLNQTFQIEENKPIKNFIIFNSIEEIQNTEKEDNTYETIILDDFVTNETLDEIKEYLDYGGILISLNKYIQDMKSIHDQMYLSKYHRIKSVELIKREVAFDNNKCFSKALHKQPSGYITFGKKVKKLKKKKKNIDKEKLTKELKSKYDLSLLDVGNPYEDTKENEKIDYANLRE